MFLVSANKLRKAQENDLISPAKEEDTKYVIKSGHIAFGK
jgi:hypothetical protein